MAYKYVIYEKEGEIAKITLNRPHKLNTFGMGTDWVDWEGKQLWVDFFGALDEAA